MNNYPLSTLRQSLMAVCCASLALFNTSNMNAATKTNQFTMRIGTGNPYLPLSEHLPDG